MNKWQQRLRQLQSEIYALALAYKDPRVPWVARLWVMIVVGYALSPIDLIPDFIPLLGYLDDLLLVPLGLLLAIKLIPPPVMAECRERAQREVGQGLPSGKLAAVVIVTLWIVALAILVGFVLRLVS